MLLLAQTAPETWREKLERGQFSDAWALAGAEGDAIGRSSARAEILYRAGDPLGALDAAEEGLARAPEHLELLHRATAAALWLEDLDGARDHSARLSRAVATNAFLASSEREEWTRAAERFALLTRELRDAAKARAKAIARARGLALFGLLAAVCVGARIAGRYGRSSSPVS